MTRTSLKRAWLAHDGVSSHKKESCFYQTCLRQLRELRQVHVKRDGGDGDLPAFEDFGVELSDETGGVTIRQLRWPVQLPAGVGRE